MKLRYRTPDGFMTLVVDGDSDDTTIGLEFGDEGQHSSWHTHASILADLSALPEDEAVRRYVADLMEGRLVVAMLRRGGVVCDAWVVKKASGLAA